MTTAAEAAAARLSFVARADSGGYTVVAEQVVHQRYLSVYDRSVRFPSGEGGEAGAVFAFDVVGHPRAHFHAVWVLPFWADGTVTLVREYAQGPHAVVWSLPAGGVDPTKHSSLEDAARAELSEEAQLRAGELVRLLPADHPGVVEAKWCANRFTPYLALALEEDSAPGARDAEELHLTTHRVPLAELERLLFAGELLPPAALTAMWGLAELRRRGLIS